MGEVTGSVIKRRSGAFLVALLLLVVAAAPTSAAGIHVVRHGPRTANQIALTIDDGWNTPNCRAMLAILERERVPATWFPIGMYVKAHASFWREVARLGYPIGNHTQHHEDLSKLSYQQQLDEIVRARNTMASVGIPMVPIIRPPFGAWNKDTLIAAEAAGYSEFLIWDTSVADSSRGTDTSHLHAATRGRPGSIVLMHCGPDMTVRVLPKIIASYRSRGYRFVTVPQLLGMPGPVPRFEPGAAPTISIPMTSVPLRCPSLLLGVKL
jgi:peptidoglycan-N-acetylglucosamine deacetylase